MSNKKIVEYFLNEVAKDIENRSLEDYPLSLCWTYHIGGEGTLHTFGFDNKFEIISYLETLIYNLKEEHEEETRLIPESANIIPFRK